MRTIWAVVIVLALFCAGPAAATLKCSPHNGGLHLPPGFCAIVVADHLGTARQLAVRANGDIYVALRHLHNGKGIVALRDSNGDGRADIVRYFGRQPGTGLRLNQDYLYFAPVRSVVRFRLKPGQLVPSQPPQTVVTQLPAQHQHADKTFAIDHHGALYVNIGAPSNACQAKDRTPGSKGLRPCPWLKHHGGIWRFRADRLNQTQATGARFATGMRNVQAVGINPHNHELYGVQMGRDQLHSLWPKLFSAAQSASQPGEELWQIHQGDNYGWPYCYYDIQLKRRILAPEYGGNGQKAGHCGAYQAPLMAFPAHWSPESVLFYNGSQFPKRYRHGAFISFHGSWNRAPLPQKGYNVVFVPFSNGHVAGHYQVFASGFKGTKKLSSPGAARFRPVGLAQGPDGSLYIADSQTGRIWRVIYTATEK